MGSKRNRIKPKSRKRVRQRVMRKIKLGLLDSNVLHQNKKDQKKEDNQDVIIKEEVIDDFYNTDCLNPIFGDINNELDMQVKSEEIILLIEQNNEDEQNCMKLHKNSTNGLRTYTRSSQQKDKNLVSEYKKKKLQDIATIREKDENFHLNSNRTIEDINLKVTDCIVPEICCVSVEIEIEEDNTSDFFEDVESDTDQNTNKQNLFSFLENISKFQFNHISVCPGEMYLFRDVRSGWRITGAEFKCTKCENFAFVSAEPEKY